MSLKLYKSIRDIRSTPEPRSAEQESKSFVKSKKDTEKKKSRSEKKDSIEIIPDYLTRPMLAKLSKKAIDNPSWIYEMKIDGYRVISKIVGGNVELISRNGNIYNQKYGVITEDLKRVKDSVVLDGEMIIENDKGISDFQLLQNYATTQKGTLKYYVFDILYLNGHPVTELPLIKRKELIGEFFKKYRFRNVFFLEYQTGNGKALFDEMAAGGYEGVVAKDPQSPYMAGKRSESWLKVKSTMMQEAVIAGYTLPQNTRKYIGSLVLAVYEEGRLKYIGNCGTGFNETSLKELHKKFEKLKTKICPFNKVPKLTGSKGKPEWLVPELVCNVKFSEWSDAGIMRSPVFMGLREDKAAQEVVDESHDEINSEHEENSPNQINAARQKEKTIFLSGRQVKCTNLTKVYWPESGYTKGDLIEYYIHISKYILPHLKNRPQSLNRHPNGIDGPNFYHKDMDTDQIPDWLKTVNLFSKSTNTGIDYLICNDTATLIYMANLGCIEINPWHSTYMKPDNPTYLMLDLDPGNISFTDVVNTALVIKEICDELNVPCYCKTSGATGLHIFIPILPKYDYEEVKTFAEILAVITHNRLPSTTSIERTVAKRRDKVYVDFLQNRSGQTIAAAYSVRPRPYATVSAPLDWKEVNHQLTPMMFTIKNMISRLEKTGDLWQPVLKNGISITRLLRSVEKLV